MKRTMAMQRLLATLSTDVRLQVRNGFYYAVAFVLAVFAIVVLQLPDLDWSLWVPAVVFGNLSMATFFFVAGLVLLEKREGTLEAQIVTPLRAGEYLASKVLTLVALSLGENLIMVTLVSGLRFRVFTMILGIATAAAVYTLFGFIAVARYDSINEYIVPSMFYVVGLSLPYLTYFDLWPSWALFWHPLQGSFLTMKAAFFQIGRPELVVAVASSLAWVAIAFGLSRRTFRRFVVAKEGIR